MTTVNGESGNGRSRFKKMIFGRTVTWATLPVTMTV